jgi:aminopeptidase-like protein
MVSVSHALKASLGKLGLNYRTGPFQSIIVNDEYIWENYGIPMVSFSRFPYPEYHSSKDDVSAINETALNDSAEALLGAIEILESSPMVRKRFEGNICVSNPKFDLYVDYGQIALGDVLSDQSRRKRCLMDLVPALHRPVSVTAIADHVGLSEQLTLDYLQQWAAKGLVDLF